MSDTTTTTKQARVAIMNPLQQGLKHRIWLLYSWCAVSVAIMNPLQQGLKLQPRKIDTMR